MPDFAPPPADTRALVVGWDGISTLTYWNGWIDELYIYKGMALHTEEFSVPTSAIDPAITALEYRPWDYCMQLGITAPDCSTMTVGETNDGAGTIANGTYKYRITYVNADGFESNGDSDEKSVTVAAGPSDVALALIPLSNDPQVIARKIWRTVDGGNLYRYVATIDNNHTTTYTDVMTDANLGVYMHGDSHDVPPAAIDCCEHLAQLFLLQSPNKVWWCKAFNEWEYFPGDNYEPFGSPPTAAIGQKIYSHGEYLAVFLDTEIWLLEGSSDIDFSKKKSLANRGPVHARATAHRGDVVYFLDGAGIFMFDHVRDIELTRPVIGLFEPEWGAGARLDLDLRAESRMAYLDGELYLLYKSASAATNNYLLRHNLVGENFDLVGSQDFVDIVADAKGKKVYACEGGFVYEMWTGAYKGDGSTAIYCSFKTKDFAMEEEVGGVHVLKQLEWIAFDLDADGGCSVYVYLDGVSVASWSIVAAARQVYRKRIDVDKSGYRITVSVAMNSTSKFYGFSLGVRPLEDI
jgi:hypothetical protein